MILISEFCKEAGYPEMTFDPAAISIFFSIAQTPTQLRNICRIASCIYSKQGTTVITAQNIIDLFAAPAFSLCINLLQAYVRKDRDKMMQNFMAIWATGISYEDFLHELALSVNQMGLLDPKVSQEIHQLILKGWISFAQGKTHTLDIMRLFMDCRQT